jgi:16S rRNA (uracil1498-N3)-methyltransferase
MSPYRFHLDKLTRGSVTLPPNESAHAVRVLRLKPGDPVELFDGQGRFASGEIVTTARSGVTVAVKQIEEAPPPHRPALTLITAMPRPHRQQILFEKCTELGVARIVPARFERSTVKPKNDAVDKWRKITIEAAKQSGCAYLPAIDRPVDFKSTLTMVSQNEVCLVAAIGKGAEPLGAQLGHWRDASNLRVWIGPEGGMTEGEITAVIAAGARPVSLGMNILRIETAAIAVAAACALGH